MSVGVLEGLTSAVGDELTELAGFRSTRLTAQLNPEQKLRTGISSASSADGLAITLPAGAVDASVVVGRRFRVLSGPRTNKAALITAVGPGDALTLAAGLGGAFTAESWEIVRDADAVAQVETTFGWDATGTVIIDSVRYTYSGITPTTITGLQYIENVRSVGRIQTSGGAPALDGTTITLDDGQGTVRTFELTLDGTVTGGHVAVPFTNSDTATQTRDAIIAVITAPDFEIAAAADDDITIGLENLIAGAQGDTPIVSTVPGFVVLGMAGGGVAHVGVIQTHVTGAEVVDFSQDYSAIDAYFRSFTSDGAVENDLSILGKNLGVPRPSGLDVADDGVYRRLIQAIAYSPRGTTNALELALDVLLPDTYEIYEDFTSGEHNNTVFVRRTDNLDRSADGKALLDGEETRTSSDGQNLTTSRTPLAMRGVRLADDPSARISLLLNHMTKDGGREPDGRLIDFGKTSASTDGTTVTGTFRAAVRPGDIFTLLTGPRAGARATIRSATTGALTLGSLAGAAHTTLGAVSFARAAFKITRPVSNFRFYKPSEERYLEYVGDTGSTPWVFFSTGGLAETAATLPGGYLQMVDGVGSTLGYRHLARIVAESEARFSALVDLSTLTATDSGDAYKQFTMQLADGARRMSIGIVTVSGSGRKISFIDDSGAFIVGYAFDYAAIGGPWVELEIRKHGTAAAELWLNGTHVITCPYASLPTTSAQELIFGNLSTDVAATSHLKQVDWKITTSTDFWNKHGSGSTAAPNLLNGTFVAGDKMVHVKDFTALNASGGNARGVWNVASQTGTSQVALVGPQIRNLAFDIDSPTHVVAADFHAFVWPDNNGASLVIEDGLNAGTYAIVSLLDPVDESDFVFEYLGLSARLIGTPPSGGWTGAKVPQLYTNKARLSTALPHPEAGPAKAHLIPAFPTDSTVPYEIAPAGAYTGAALTLRSAIPVGYPTLLAVAYSTVLSAQALDSADSNEPVGAFHPFYLWDAFGFIRDVLSGLVVAGVVLDLDHFVRDSTGPHVWRDS